MNWLKKYDLPRNLLDQLITNSRTETQITLRSDQKGGWLTDSNGSFQKYQEGNTFNWDKLHRDRPKAFGFTFLSRPAYDKDQGLVLVYIGQLRGDYDGEGFLVLYDYKQGELREIKKVSIWMP